MKKNLFVGAFALTALIAMAVYVGVVSANGVASGVSAGTANSKTLSPSVSTTVVISQAYGGGGGASGTYINDYVELKNISASSQSLDGLSLMYGSATGQFGSSAGNIFALPTGVTLSPGQYYLIQLSSAGTGGVALPVTPDATTTNLSMSGTNGKVALTNGLSPNSCGATATPCTLPNAQIVDLVSWGTANNAEGGASTNGGSALTATQGNVRKGAGCTDTDNNNADFDVITAPVPRNSATTAAPCGPVAVTQHVVDYDGDGKTDFSVLRFPTVTPPGVAQITYWNKNSGGNVQIVDWGDANTDYPTPGDYDGDGKTDFAVYRAGATAGAQSVFYILRSSNSTFTFVPFGLFGDKPVARDFDGDGKTDPAIFRPGTAPGDQATWWIRKSTTNTDLVIPFGTTGDGTNTLDTPVPGDYDGDGKFDLAVYRVGLSPANTFIYLRSSDGQVVYQPWGNFQTDYILPGDYDGDGKTDFCAGRTGATGTSPMTWYILQSSNSQVRVQQFGISSDSPVQGDYDGDGKTDIAVYRRGSPSIFWVLGSSSSSVSATSWGLSGDFPVANFDAR